MDLIWCIPAAVLVGGAGLLLWRIRVVDAEVASTVSATRRLAVLGEAGVLLQRTVSSAADHRSRTHDAIRSSTTPADRRPHRSDR